jgi:hypothetical protein
MIMAFGANRPVDPGKPVSKGYCMAGTTPDTVQIKSAFPLVPERFGVGVKTFGVGTPHTF